MCFFPFQRIVLLTNTQCHFFYFTVQNRELTLIQFVNIQTIIIVKHKINLIGNFRNASISGSGVRVKGSAKNGGRHKCQYSSRTVDGKSQDGKNSGHQQKQNRKLLKFFIPEHGRPPDDSLSHGQSG